MTHHFKYLLIFVYKYDIGSAQIRILNIQIGLYINKVPLSRRKSYYLQIKRKWICYLFLSSNDAIRLYQNTCLIKKTTNEFCMLESNLCKYIRSFLKKDGSFKTNVAK